MNYSKIIQPILLISILPIVGCTNKPTVAVPVECCSKSVLEPVSSSGQTYASNDSTPAEYYSSSSPSVEVEASHYVDSSSNPSHVADTFESSASEELKLVTQSQARSMLQARGISYGGSSNGIQVDGIPVTLNSDEKVIVLEISNASRTIEAKGRDVVVIGSASKVVIGDRCGKLLVSGNKNVISSASVRNMEVHGFSNHVTLGNLVSGVIHGDSNRVDWTRSGPKPDIALNGDYNSVADSR